MYFEAERYESDTDRHREKRDEESERPRRETDEQTRRQRWVYKQLNNKHV